MTGTEGQVRARVAGPACASDVFGQVELPIKLDGCNNRVTVHIARWQIARLIAQLERADTSAREIKRLRSRKH